jgi:hypothetical protein
LKPVEIAICTYLNQEVGFLNLERIHDVLYLCIAPESYITFREEWVEQLRALPYGEFGAFMRDTIYPALSDQERKAWRRSQINNRDLQAAVLADV